MVDFLQKGFTMACKTSNWRGKLGDKTRINNEYVREFLAELVGTFILLVIGDGTVAQVVLSGGAKGGFITINWCWGLAVAFGVYAAGGVSGAHINPAVSIAFAVIGRFPWIKVPLYSLAQVLGAFLGAAFVFAVYCDAINDFDGGVRQVVGDNATAGVFATYPQDFLSIPNALGDQIFGTFLLMFLIAAVIDKRNASPVKGMEPYMIGMIVAAIGMSFGYNCGYAINPARDFGPRLFTAVAGYGPEVWVYNDQHFWLIPIIGPIIGAILGAVLYVALIENHHPSEESSDEAENNGLEEVEAKEPKPEQGGDSNQNQEP